MNARERKELVDKILRALRDKYEVPEPSEERSEPLAQLIRSVLSEDAPDGATEKAVAEMEKEFVDWNEVRVSTVHEIAEVLGRLPRAREKAERVKSVLQAIFEKTGRLDLSFLQEKKPDEIKHELLQLDGVTPQAAAAVLFFSFGVPAIPLDYSLRTLMRRLGLIEEDEPTETAQDLIERAVKKRDMADFYLLMKAHAASVCTPERKNCRRCVLAGLCAEHGGDARSSPKKKKNSTRKKSSKSRSKKKK